TLDQGLARGAEARLCEQVDAPSGLQARGHRRGDFLSLCRCGVGHGTDDHRRRRHGIGTKMQNLNINGDRLWESLMEMATIGATEKGGVCRLALSDLDKAGRELFIRWCEQAGCTVSVDRMGNIFARRPGRNPKLAPVLAGSHLDTQPTGGCFDGV